ncbi:hypothetical protein [Streptomyces kaniharaensis]|uniref:hypothetical protein n=1 Tax=Streptomyces kaniharaensis TaxID=212423 RepID=UPI001296E529|nr:hypothetical protein [Streptomyces kaniharaensis]
MSNHVWMHLPGQAVDTRFAVCSPEDPQLVPARYDGRLTGPTSFAPVTGAAVVGSEAA